ncbi:MAG: NUDIX domain-containing protein [Phycisphaerales bacterium JB054]
MHTSPHQLPEFRPASFLPLHCALGDITIAVDRADPPAPTPSMVERWEAAAAANPRLFNGSLLRFHRFDAATRTIHASNDTYQRYAMQDRPPAVTGEHDHSRGVSHLAVTGVVIATDADTGREAVVLGKRGEQTFVYPGLWEHAPGGGLETTEVYEQLLREMGEELGIRGLDDPARRDELLVPPGSDDVLGLAFDPNMPSVDVVVRLRLREGAERALREGSWEYGDTRLVPVDSLPGFLGEQGERAIIPPAVAIWRAMGWV